MKKIIFNADDLATSEKVNEGIFLCAKTGIVKSTSLIITSSLAKESYQQATELGLSVGLHLNVSGEGKFLKESLLFGKNGKINHAFKNGKTLSKPEITETIDEFKRQLELFESNFKKKPDHINHHHPLYMIPNFPEAFAEFVESVDIPTRWYKDISSYPLKFPNYTEFGFYEPKSLTVENLTKLLRDVPDGTSEFVLHPGLYDPNSTSSYNQGRNTQVKVITNPEFQNYWKSSGYATSTFNDI